MFYSFLSTRDAFGGGPDPDPDGSGGGAAASLSLPLGFFAAGEYAYNYQHDSNDGFGFDQQVRQGRIGGGYAIYLPMTPLSVYADGEYIHLRLEPLRQRQRHRAITTMTDGGFHGGLRFTLPWIEFLRRGGLRGSLAFGRTGVRDLGGDVADGFVLICSRSSTATACVLTATH